MHIEITEIRKQDYQKAIEFAIRGMHFEWYLGCDFLLKAYGRYFWYLEINRATQILAAYVDNEFAGVLLAEMYTEKKQQNNLFQKIYVKIVDVMQKTFFKDGAGLYEETTKAQLENYLLKHRPDGEIIFLAANPDCKVKGIGTVLLHALEEREMGKKIYLHTDDACTYQFYERRGFVREEETDIVLEMPKGKVPLKCLLYSKTIKENEFKGDNLS